MKVTIYCEVKENGDISISKLVREAINQHRGGRVEIIIQKEKKKRSNDQNAYFHGVVIPMITQRLKDLGTFITKEKVKDMLKARYLALDEPIGDEGECISIVRDTSELSTIEFMDFISQIVQWAAEILDLQIPEPNEEMKLDLE